MPETRLYLDQLGTGAALDLLDRAVSRGLAPVLDEVLIEVTQSAFGNTAALAVPEGPSGSGHPVKDLKQAKTALTELIEAYRALGVGEPRRMETREGGMPIAQGLVWLLLHCELDLDDPPEDMGERLLIDRGDADAAASLFEDLRFHATHTRVAAASDARGTCFVFHLRDDSDRLSSLDSLVASGRIAPDALLEARQVDGYRIFVPRTCRADRLALGAFTRILLAAPQLVGSSTASPESGLLYAVDGSDDKQFELLYLGGLQFQGQALLAPAVDKAAQVVSCDLVDKPQALDQLRAALVHLEPKIGYRLELRTTRHQEDVEMERVRLLERQAELDYRIAYLDSIARPRPRLFRFSSRQLPAMAELIRGLPMKTLREGFPLYGFQALQHSDAQRQDGFHYILIEPEDGVSGEMDPLLRWGHLDDNIMGFQLDPFWARYYHGEGNSCLVFVPEGKALFPSMHGWDVDSMDRYMRETMSAWFAERGDLPRIPDKPIYIFDGDRNSPDGLKITLLDQEALGPLHARLGWINDHLTVADAVGLERYVKDMAADAARIKLANQLRDDADREAQHFDQLVGETNRRVAERLDELTSVVTEEFNSLIAETHRTTMRIKEYHDYLEQLNILKDDSRKTAELAEKTVGGADFAVKEVSAYLVHLEQQVEAELKQAYKVRRMMKGRVQRTIRELGDTHQELKEQLKNALRLTR